MKLDIKSDKKKIIIIVSSVLVLLLIIFLIIFPTKKSENVPDNKTSDNKTKVTKSFTPELLTAKEKARLKIPSETKVQVMARDQQGEATVYKVIKNDSDIVDPAQVEPVSPRSLER